MHHVLNTLFWVAERGRISQMRANFWQHWQNGRGVEAACVFRKICKTCTTLQGYERFKKPA